MRHVAASAFLVWVMTVMAAAPAHADEKGPPFRPRERCLPFYEQQKYEELSDCLRELYALYPAPPLLFNIAQAERLAGNCREAIVFYEKFLEADPEPKPEQAAEAQEHLEACRIKVASEPPPPPAVPDATPEPAPLPPPAPDTSRPSGLPPFLLAGGLVAIAMGSLMLAADLSDSTDAYITLGIGGALAVTGTTWLLLRRSRTSPSSTATLSLDRTTITAGFALSF